MNEPEFSRQARADLKTVTRALGFRTFVVSEYVAVFRPVDDTIEILRFLHGSRDIPRIIREETEL